MAAEARLRYPAYLNLSAAEFSQRVQALYALAAPCRLCPRRCGVHRDRGEKGFCRTGLRPWISSFGPHFGEERELVGRFGSGTIFFSGCNLGCVFCQNFTISQLGEGEEISVEALAKVMLRLQDMGCHNVNLVTPTHQAPMIIEALGLAREEGLGIPLVWNCGGYESLEVLRLLDGIVDIYMPDFKYGDDRVAAKFSAAPDYFERACEALREMHRQVGDLVVKNGVAVRGLLVRHLVLPRGLAGTAKVLQFIRDEISQETYVNLMAQYYPTHRAWEFPELSRRITSAEYKEALAMAQSLGLRRAGPH
ncbi:MAG: radical SAM protein [Candidatus Bipolaricaulota bacterium]|nr:radical SAM protein [Candidatus Bipolaricaulota bacterium]MDW8127036.1 radical SAM protein [Candidatus Bipolaricaulota bacterium]